MRKATPKRFDSLIQTDNPDDLDGRIPQSAQGDPQSLVEKDNPDDVEIPDQP
ncbi:hypothetical protein [Effusibacillus lacus]|uniref:Uncharacterized protein n=1 Tax=Effusibacillus lacus TaxID=1348429 RepID=A0A292YLP5_9BACL|nr:hypothetical protein [Effusibacillus lacus]TCS75254.1 hypothetical protein EDD64_1084 [Effusibacillus lacus]GAX89693.1 hypothetical protein EFBL_1317 [Effusibacillus lacus]